MRKRSFFGEMAHEQMQELSVEFQNQLDASDETAVGEAQLFGEDDANEMI